MSNGWATRRRLIHRRRLQRGAPNGIRRPRRNCLFAHVVSPETEDTFGRHALNSQIALRRLFAGLRQSRELVDVGKQQRRNHERHMHDGEPHQLNRRVDGVVEKYLQQVDRRNGDDGGGNLDLQRTDVDRAQPVHLGAGSIKAADEILVAGDDDHHDQAGDQGGVDQPEHFQDRVCIV